ncbi:MAG: AAA family ATPase, partial [Clostridia bacterium]|nr:AAA family ATPase [Clostridia bacterium]
MLFSLHIENIAVIKNVDIDFSSGFMALTGETGAGKSIILDSINLLLGKKAEREIIRSGTSSAMVSGLFGGIKDSCLKFLKECGISVDEDGSILVQRTIGIDGHSQIKINGRSVSLTVLKSVMPSLVAIHGQTDTLALTDAERQLELLDLYAENKELLSEYSEKYKLLSAARDEIRSLLDKESERERLIEILEYQIADIDSLSLKDGEEEELIDKKLKIKNSEKINKNAGFAFKALRGSEKGSVAFLVDKSISALEQISDVVPEFSEYPEKLRDILYQVNDISEEIYSVIADMDDDPGKTLNQIESRLDKISKLKRKYGLTVKDILEFRERSLNELDELKNSDSVIKKLEARERELYKEALAIAERLHERRVAAAKTIEEKVKSTLDFLDMLKVVFFA